MINIIPFVVFFVILLINKMRIGRWIALSNAILAFYTSSMLCFFLYSCYYSTEYDYTIKGLLTILIPVVVMVSPLSKFEKKQAYGLTRISQVKLKKIAFFFIVLSVYSIFFYGVNLGKVVAYGVVALRDARIVFYESNIFSKIAAVGAFSSPICLFFYFYGYVTKSLEKKYLRLLFISSTSFVFYTLNVAGRDGIIIWIFSIIGLVALFYRFMDKSVLIQILKPILLILPPFIIILAIISMARFSESSNGTFASLISYLGQGLENLSYNIDIAEKSGITGNKIWSVLELPATILSNLGLIDGIKNTWEQMDSSLALGFRANQFSFYVGLYPITIPFVGLVLFVFITTLVYKFNLKISVDGIISTSRLLVAFSWYMILLVGVFYFYYGSVAGNFYLLFPFIIALYIRMK